MSLMRNNINVESDNPGFKSFYNCFYIFYDKIDIDEDYYFKYLLINTY